MKRTEGWRERLKELADNAGSRAGDCSQRLAMRRALKELADNAGSRAQAAALAGVHKDQFQRYLSGRNAPSFVVVAEFVAAVDGSLDWVAYGHKRESLVAINDEVLTEIIVTIEEEAVRRGNRPTARQIAALIVHCYDEEMRHPDAEGRAADPQAIRRAFRLIS